MVEKIAQRLKSGKSFTSASGQLTVPKLEVAAILFLPILVQIDKDIDATIDFELWMVAVVGMHFKRAA